MIGDWGLTDERERAFVDAWLVKRLSGVAAAIGPVGGGVCLFSVILVLLTAPAVMMIPGAVIQGTLGVLLLLPTLLKSATWPVKASLLLGAQLAAASAYAWFSYYLLLNSVDGYAFAVVACIFVCMTFLFIFLCPIPNYCIMLCGAYYIGLGAWSMWSSPYPFSMIAMHACFIAASVALEYVRVRQVLVEARGQYRHQQLVEANHRLENEAMTRDLVLARKIQDSFSPPDNPTSLCGFRVEHYMQKHAEVGGDWLAIRPTGPQSFAVLVVDAVGKGVQAALVLHAAQTLWARSLTEPFEAAAWLGSLNQALCQLGRRAPQCMTAAIAEVSATEVRYISAGHVPLYCLSGGGGDAKAHLSAVPAGGDMLGLSPALKLQATAFSFGALERPRLVLGSDGVLPSPSKATIEFFRGLLRGLETDGVAALARVESGDDKLCVVIERG